jgi:hypothetical protein
MSNSEGEKINYFKKIHKRAILAQQTEPKLSDCFWIYKAGAQLSLKHGPIKPNQISPLFFFLLSNLVTKISLLKVNKRKISIHAYCLVLIN